MRHRCSASRRLVLVSLAALTAALCARHLATAQDLPAPPSRPLDVIYVPTPDAVVTRMLSLVKVTPRDIVYDLGSGDGRIVIAAVKDFGARRGVGIELDPQRIVEARENAERAGVASRVTFLQADIFEADVSDASVVTMYLLPGINARLAPKLRALKPGTRIASHNYDMGSAWKPARTVFLERDVIHLWTVPKR